MRAGPPLRSSFIVLSAGWALGLGCFLDTSALDPAGGSTTSTTGGGGTTSSTTSNGGSGGTTTTATLTTGGGGSGGSTTTTTLPTGGGGSGGSTSTTMSSGGGGSGGSTTTTTMPPTTPASCAEAKTAGMAASGTVVIDPDGDMIGEDPFLVYCDQVYDGGGWALVYNSVADMNVPNGQTTAFWNISKADSLKPKGTPGVMANYYDGRLYKYKPNQIFRDEILDYEGVLFADAVRVKSNGFDEGMMKFAGPEKLSGNAFLFAAHFNGHWSSADFDGDGDGIATNNCALLDSPAMTGVSQHYAGCWYYSLGADADVPNLDGGWGPHVTLSLIAMDAALTNLKVEPTPGQYGGRVKRISRFTRW
jgi:hypothetical protein